MTNKFRNLLGIFVLSTPLVSVAANKTVNCQVQDFNICSDCGQRVPVSCENHLFNGSLDWKTKVEKVTWIISNRKVGTEKRITTPAPNLHLKDLKLRQNWKSLALKQKVKVGREETVELATVDVPEASALYSNQSSKTIVQMKSQDPSRSVASAEIGSEPVAGGIKRAQMKMNHK